MARTKYLPSLISTTRLVLLCFCIKSHKNTNHKQSHQGPHWEGFVLPTTQGEHSWHWQPAANGSHWATGAAISTGNHKANCLCSTLCRNRAKQKGEWSLFHIHTCDFTQQSNLKHTHTSDLQYYFIRMGIYHKILAIYAKISPSMSALKSYISFQAWRTQTQSSNL